MRLYFIRHGQSANNLLWDETGNNQGRSEDPELTPTGHKQARLLAAFVRRIDDEAGQDGQVRGFKRNDFCFTHLYTSLMVRSVATGTYLSKALRLPLVGWPEIHECGGIYYDDDETGEPVGLPGKTRAYFQEHYNHLVLPDSCTDEGWWNRPFESRESRPARARQVVETLFERHGGTNDRVAIVSHGAFYMEMVRILFKIENRQVWFMMNNTAVSRFDFYDDGEVSLGYHNRTAHLPEELIT